MPFLVFLAAALITIALVPYLERNAARYGFVDMPDFRKVHDVPIPRIGGLAMVIGSMLPLMLWLPLDARFLGIIAGVVLISIFGVWDDRSNLDYRLKFFGQIMAALVAVLPGDIVIRAIPFGPLDGLPDMLAIPLTVVFIVGITNAINLSDGLDGLAGGTSLLSIVVIALLAYLAGDESLLALVLAVGGSIFGFLRFNTHPAIIFMGDTGSQFLGYLLGIMTIILTQSSNPALSPVLMLLLLSLPILDTLVVMVQRIREGRSPFSPDKNHFHHKLLSCGFHHYEAVMAIYLLQGLFVGAALFLRYQSDLLLLFVFVSSYLSVAIFIYASRRLHALPDRKGGVPLIPNLFRKMESSEPFRRFLFTAISTSISVYLIVNALQVREVPQDFAVLASIVFLALAVRLVFGYKAWFLYLRLMIYVTIAFVVYLAEIHSSMNRETLLVFDYIFFVVLALAVVLAISYHTENNFRVNTMDVLLVLVLLVLGALPENIQDAYHLVPVAVKLIVLFYGAEIVMKHMTTRWSLLPLSVLGSLGVLIYRGYVF